MDQLPPIAAPSGESTRVTRPTTISGMIGIPGGLGLDVSHHFSDRFAVSGQASTWVGVTDIGAQVRFFPIASERAGLYLAGGVHALYAPILFPTFAPAASAEIGGEFRARNGFTIGGGVGVMGLYAPPGSEGGGNEFSPAPLARIRIGRSF